MRACTHCVPNFYKGKFQENSKPIATLAPLAVKSQYMVYFNKRTIEQIIDC